MYCVMILCNSFEPIFNFIGTDPLNERFQEFKKIKLAKEFCQVNKCDIFIEALSECYDTKYEAEPTYTKVDFLLKKLCLNRNLMPTGRFSTVKLYQ